MSFSPPVKQYIGVYSYRGVFESSFALQCGRAYETTEAPDTSLVTKSLGLIDGCLDYHDWSKLAGNS